MRTALTFSTAIADHGDVVSGTSSVVPANRLGQLLAEARLRKGADLEDFASRSDFTVGELSDLESGHRTLDEQLVSQVTGLYEIDCGPIVPQRAELTIDLTDNKMSAAGKAVRLDSAAHDHVLERYLSLVYVLRNNDPGTKVPLRDEDVAILAASLAEREELIEEQLLRAMAEETESVSGLVGWFRNRLWVPGAGALVGMVSVGTLVMLSSDSGALQAPTAEPEPEPDGAARPSPVAGLILSGSTTTTAESASATTARPSSSTSSETTSTTTSRPARPDAPRPTMAEGAAPAAVAQTDASPAAVGAAAEALLPFDWQQALPGWTIVYSGPDSSFRGLTYPYDKSIEMFVRPDDTPQSLAGILAHELGHAIDVTHFDDGDRSRWKDARGIDAQWWPDAYASDFQSGAGDFAEAFAYWAVNDPSSSQIAGNPTSSQINVLRDLTAGVL